MSASDLSTAYATAVNGRARSLGVRLQPLARSTPPNWTGWIVALGFAGFVLTLLAIRSF